MSLIFLAITSVRIIYYHKAFRPNI